MKIAHPQSSAAVQQLENEIAAKKAELAQLIAKQAPQLIQHYTFLDHQGKDCSLLELFGEKEELILVFYMGYQCKYCTLWADGYNGLYDHLSDRTAFAVVSHETPAFQTALREERGWKFPMYSRQHNQFAQDLGFTDPKDNDRPLPGMATFIQKDGQVYLHHRSYFGPGDNYCVHWDFLNRLPKGINEWVPEYHY
jgi:predicted dithiol-disulfide oxidoreductase (DUF899 family)